MHAVYRDFAAYNHWANARLYDTVATLSSTEFHADRGAFFRSVNGTLNHLLVTDRIWLARLAGEKVPSVALNAILFDTLPDLRAARTIEDARIIAYVESLDESCIAAPIAYANTAGEPDERPLWQVLSHLFNHQTHHRAQAQTVLNQFSRPVPPLDFIYFQRERC